MFEPLAVEGWFEERLREALGELQLFEINACWIAWISPRAWARSLLCLSPLSSANAAGQNKNQVTNSTPFCCDLWESTDASREGVVRRKASAS